MMKVLILTVLLVHTISTLTAVIVEQKPTLVPGTKSLRRTKVNRRDHQEKWAPSRAITKNRGRIHVSGSRDSKTTRRVIQGTRKDIPKSIRHRSNSVLHQRKGIRGSQLAPSSLLHQTLSTGNICGTSWADAGERCEASCPNGTDSECPSGQFCFASITCSSSPSSSENYCGTSWENAGSTCQTTCPNGVDSDCPSGQYCFASVSCGGSSSGTPTPTPTPTSTPTTSSTSNYCGTDWNDAQAQCVHTCPGGTNDECPSGESCFASISCSNGGTNSGSGYPEVQGYYELTWTTSTPQAGSNLAVAFSGWVDVTSAKSESDLKYSSLIGSKYISFGGGNSNGHWTASALTSIDSAITSGTLQSYDGICYDIEEGDAGLSSAFAQSFQVAKQNGFNVLVTVSHSAPYGMTDSAQVMNTILSSSNVDYVSPQLYTTGTETQNDYVPTAGYAWSNFASSQPKVIASITQTSLYSDAESTFSTYGVSLVGYVLWTS